MIELAFTFFGSLTTGIILVIIPIMAVILGLKRLLNRL